MIVLGIETSCDETAVAVVRNGRDVLSHVVWSQAARHAPYGGVVPEIASRCHVEAVTGRVDQAMEQAGLPWEAIDRVAATCGPGLSSSLLVGLSAAKGLALRLGRPFCGIHHLEGHLYAPFLGQGPHAFAQACPFVALLVSGGHTLLAHVSQPGRYALLGRTLDDAAGEALDKGAMLMGLGYPGGAAIERVAQGGDPCAFRFPRSRPRKPSPVLQNMHPDFCFSFSGLKTALLRTLEAQPLEGRHDPRLPSMAASYQEAVVDALTDRCDRALRHARTLVAGGGVTLNGRLRSALSTLANKRGVRLCMADPPYCGDNAAMIAGLAGAPWRPIETDALAVDVHPSLPLPTGSE